MKTYQLPIFCVENQQGLLYKFYNIPLIANSHDDAMKRHRSLLPQQLAMNIETVCAVLVGVLHVGPGSGSGWTSGACGYF